MKSIRMVWLFITVCFFSQSYAAEIDPDVYVKQTISHYMEKNKIPGVAVELVIDGQPSSYYFGYANRDKHKPITNQTIFELGSISKVMTALLLAQEIDAAKVQLDDSLTQFFPDLPEEYEDITLKNLATHTSGLPFDPPSSITTSPSLEKYLQQWKPSFGADEEWQYSNFGIGMLAYSLETVTHKNFNQLYLSKIVKPLRMLPLGLTIPHRYQPYYAQGYDKDEQPINSVQIKLFPAAGGLKASAHDMQRFLQAAIGLPGTPERIFYPMRLTQVAYVELPDKMQGLGWDVNYLDSDNRSDLLNPQPILLKPIEITEIFDQPVFDGNVLIDKTGTTRGFRSYIALIPNKKSGIVILTNKTATDTEIVKIGREILFRFAKISTKTVDEGSTSIS